MGSSIKPGIVVSFANQKGGVGKSTLTLLLADYLHTTGKKYGLKVAVVDSDDSQSTLARKRAREGDKEAQYKIMSISSADLSSRIEMLKDLYDIILIDLPGNMKQPGVFTVYHLIDVVFLPMEPSDFDIDSSLLFYEALKEIINTRNISGYKTSVYGIFNRVNTQIIEFKDSYEKRHLLPFEFMDEYIKDSRVTYQRGVSTHDMNLREDAFEACESMLRKITEHVNS